MTTLINKLPHHLIAAFRATLSEIKEADLLINVLDASHPRLGEQNSATYSVLKELKADSKPIINVLNKIDLINNGHKLSRLSRDMNSSVTISALHKKGLEELIRRISGILGEERVYGEFTFPYQRNELISLVYSEAEVMEKHYSTHEVTLKVRLSKSLADKLAKYRRRESPEEEREVDETGYGSRPRRI